MSLPPAQLLPIATTSADLQLLTGLYVLRGWTFVETTGAAAATFELYDGTVETNPLVTSLALAQATSTAQWLAGNGVLLRTGLFLEILTGSVKGCIYYNAITHVDDVNAVIGDYGPHLVHPGI